MNMNAPAANRVPPAAVRDGIGHDIIVVGASAGGVIALTELIKQFPNDFPAAVFIAYHMPRGAEGYLADTLNSTGPLPAKLAEDGEAFRHGVVYVAPPDRHLLIKPGHVRVTHGPRENRWRPAIDPLFRSAAVAYGARVIGIVLSGMLDDGTAGLLAIKKCGGIAMVQDPSEAAYPDMPQSALANVHIDHRLAVMDMGEVLARLVRESAGQSPDVPRELELEARFAEAGSVVSAPEQANATGLSCPECGGPLRDESMGDFHQYRCLVGHAFSPQSLLAGSNEALEATVWAAIRLFRQRANLLTNTSVRERNAGRVQLAEQYAQMAAEAREHSNRLQILALEALDSPPSVA
jgi:two-component system, chemotaxis family, protein-glutamate methylesterase/glutaminase